MESRRTPLATLASLQPSATPALIRTYSRKRKRVEESTSRIELGERMERSGSVTPMTPRKEEIVVMSPPSQASKKTQKSISSFFQQPKSATNTSSPTTCRTSTTIGSSPIIRHAKSTPNSSPPQPVMTQLHLANLGPSTRTSIHCKTCQMHYNKIDPHDQKLHKTHHMAILSGPLFPRITVLTTAPLPSSPIHGKGDLVVISRSSSKDLQKRALNLLNMVDIALGAPPCERPEFFPHDGKVYFLLSSSRIISLVASQRIASAYRRLPSASAVETTNTKEKALVGISRMWTCIEERGKGWCRALLEECAAGFVFGMDCSRGGRRALVAFSTPSESGLAVARKWTGREDFLVYDD